MLGAVLTGSWASPEPLGVAGQGPHGLRTPPFCLLWKDGEHPTRYGPQTCSFLLCLHLPFSEMGIILCSFPRLTGTHAHRALVEVAPGENFLHRMFLSTHRPTLPPTLQALGSLPRNPPWFHLPLLSHPFPSPGSFALAQGPWFPTAVLGTQSLFLLRHFPLTIPLAQNILPQGV